MTVKNEITVYLCMVRLLLKEEERERNEKQETKNNNKKTKKQNCKLCLYSTSFKKKSKLLFLSPPVLF